ncbi:MAG: UDP-N-acetylmuramate--L-alanine ligase [Acidimicrobiia bacterium]|nr:UDP-N-acetylmuramate--L-alanine ligase [Acidimicrobiia bacterium]
MSASIPVPPLDLSRPSRLHVIGVGGPGMSAIAIVLAEMGHVVSGSDLREQPVLDRVRAAGVDVRVGHDPTVVHGVDAVTASSAVPATNVELVEAARVGCLTLRRAGMLASICAQARAIGVAGTHGKTTTSSMLAMVMAEAALDPSFVIGGDVADAGTGARWTGKAWLVVEADESDGTHLELPLHATILTNVDVDHLDHFGSFEAVVESFDRLLARVPGPKVVCGDDPVAARLAEAHGAVTYGLSAGVTVRGVDVEVGQGSFGFTVERDGDRLGTITLPLRGVHNVVNALGVVAMAIEVGIDVAVVSAALARFGGVARRFDIRGHDGGATFVDDYAHLPAEIAAVIAAARHSGDRWSRVVAVFQPNRFHRIADMWRRYADAFVEADVVVVTDVYASGTMPIPGVTGRLIVNAVLDAHPATRVVWLPRRDDVVSFLAGEVGRGDVCLSMGCGDIAALPDEVLVRRGQMRRRSA